MAAGWLDKLPRGTIQIKCAAQLMQGTSQPLGIAIHLFETHQAIGHQVETAGK
jgi:hypothetical protein